jgi:hypothetical protein
MNLLEGSTNSSEGAKLRYQPQLTTNDGTKGQPASDSLNRDSEGHRASVPQLSKRLEPAWQMHISDMLQRERGAILQEIRTDLGGALDDAEARSITEFVSLRTSRFIEEQLVPACSLWLQPTTALNGGGTLSCHRSGNLERYARRARCDSILVIIRGRLSFPATTEQHCRQRNRRKQANSQ